MNSPESAHDNSKSGSRLTLAGQLMVLVAVVALGPLLVTNYVGYQRTKDVLSQVTHQSLSNAAQVAAADTTEFVRERQNLLSSLVAGNIHLAKSSANAARALAGDPNGDSVPASPLERHLNAKATSITPQTALYVMSAQGQILGSSEGVEHRGAWRRDDPCRNLTGEPGSLDIRHAGDATLYVAEPIPAVGGESPGVLCARFGFGIYDELRELAQSQSQVQRFLIVNRDGHALSNTTDDTVTLPEALREHLVPGKPWHGTFESAQGDSSYAAIAPVGATDWFIVADIDGSSAMAMLEELKQRVFVMGSGFVLVVVLGMLLMVRTTITPLRDLVDATQKMTRGELAQTVETRGPREVAELASVFNTMSSRVARLHHTLEDRVEQRTSELRRNQVFSEILFNSMHENLMVLDDQMRVVDANDAAKRTYGEDLIGKPCYEAFEASECCEDSCPIQRAFATGEPVEEERVHLRASNAEIMHTQVFPLPAPAGQEPSQVLMVTRPITDEKQELASAAANEKVSAYALMAASVAHELGNPLSSISAQLQLAKRKDDPAFTNKVLDVIDGQVDRMEGLLRDITAFSSRQSHRATLVYWNQIIEDAVRLLKHDPRGRFASFDLDLADELPAVYAEPERCFQVVLNLGLNALDAMEGRGTLTIQTRLDDGQVVIRVSDTGPGVSAEVRDHMFDPYFTTKESTKGSGLGLFISRRIINQMDGELDYEAPVDDGASFVIRVPHATQEKMRAEC